jgi:hypothetical protein
MCGLRFERSFCETEKMICAVDFIRMFFCLCLSLGRVIMSDVRSGLLYALVGGL